MGEMGRGRVKNINLNPGKVSRKRYCWINQFIMGRGNFE